MPQSRKPSRSQFNRRSTAEDVTAGIDLSGKTVVITGVNSGLGFESMRVLALRGAHVIGAARTVEKAGEACRAVEGETTPVACELSDLASVASCADVIQGMGRPVDVLLCNAGIMALPRLEQKYGLELQFLTNHLGHFVLIHRLLDRVKEADAGRVVIVSSDGHQLTPKGGIDFDNLSGDAGYSSWRFYGQSKLANVLTSNELARQVEGSRMTSNALHPGVIRTNLIRHGSGIVASLISAFSRPFERSLSQGAATQCYVAVHPDLEGVGGHYFSNSNPARPSRLGLDANLARRLWDVSEQLVADYL